MQKDEFAQHYCFDGSLTGLLSCVFRAFQFKDRKVSISTPANRQESLFAESIEVVSDEQHATRVWQGLAQRLSEQAIRQLYYAYLSEDAAAYQDFFDYCIYVFTQQAQGVEKNYTHVSVLSIAQWAKKVGREKHRMEAFVRFKKTADGLFLALVYPDFNVLPLIHRHFQTRYQDQRWLIYDEKRQYGIYYDLEQLHEVSLNSSMLDRNIATGKSQSFCVDLDEKEWLYDQLWQDYFKSINIKARRNIKLHVQYLPRRYWRYLNEKQL